MRIEHVALWTRDLEGMKDFYVEFFGGAPGDKYTNPKTGFSSYFLSFDAGARLELMQMEAVSANENDIEQPYTGWTHVAFAVGSREAVDALTARLGAAGCRVASGPRVTGDGYYESCILDPDGNRVEIVFKVG
ncbi:MAG: VOC family protein [Anaerolineae bacterium]|nr:VOC family protein [Anaerolineae bacterium]